MSRPLLLDLFCGAGGAAVGYHRAGFDVVGVDSKPQPHYPFQFHRDDALRYVDDVVSGRNTFPFQAIHASPPCQAYTQGQRLQGNEHPDLLPPTRGLLRSTGLPYVIENVPGAPMIAPFTLCGRSMGLGVKRHRWFETNVTVMVPPCGSHGDYITVFGHSVEQRGNKRIARTVADGRRAMGIDWMNRDELSEASPPAYTEFIGEQLLIHLNRSRATA
jgi:DNA (cytosine-5)-methyltransferase 1